jgi:hypothetical protein
MRSPRPRPWGFRQRRAIPDLSRRTSLVFGGSGANRTLTFTPADGGTVTAIVTVTVSDSLLTASDTFQITVYQRRPSCTSHR